MTAAITGSSIICIGFFIATGDFYFSVAISLGPISTFLLVEKKENILKDDYHIPTNEWIQKVILKTIVGFLYTGFVLFVIASVGLLIPNYDIPINPILLAVIQFVPHPFVYWKRNSLKQIT